MTWIDLLPKMILAVVLAMALVLAGCAGQSAQRIFESGEPSLKSRYGRTLAVERSITGFSTGRDEGYVRDAEKELDVLFPELPNPRLTLFVFPHITPGGAPIPGYTTAFYLYDHQRIFALPGEVAP